MITHYLKIAARNLMKYKVQSVISIFGLAVGFVCFALSAMWIEYEMTYDADETRSYILYEKDLLSELGYSATGSYPMSTTLKEMFPEVEDACAFGYWSKSPIKDETGKELFTGCAYGDSCFMNMFGIKLLKGNMDFFFTDKHVALSEEMAMKLYGTTDVLGKTFNEHYTISAVLSDLKHSNFSFGYWEANPWFPKYRTQWGTGGLTVVVRLKEGVDYKAFETKMQATEVQTEHGKRKVFETYHLMPLTEYHYADFNEWKSINFTYLMIFSIIGALVILGSLFNYLSLYVNRMQMRMREIELRKLCGSTFGSLFTMFSIEYLLVILWSGFFGMMFIEIILPKFREMSLVEGDVYGKAAVYFAGIAVLSLLMLLPFIRTRRSPVGKGQRHVFRRVSIGFQLVISILFAFCLAVLFKQIYHLRQTDMGWERHNIGVITRLPDSSTMEALSKHLKEQPFVSEVLTDRTSLLPRLGAMSIRVTQWDGQQDSTQYINIQCITEADDFARFWGIQLLEGEMITREDKGRVVINETAVKALGMTDPVGKKVGNRYTPYTIAGVMKDFHTTPPTVPVNPIMLTGPDAWKMPAAVMVKYHEGEWNAFRKATETYIEKEYPGTYYEIYNVEDVYEEYLKSENTLLQLLTSVAVVCLIISAFGIFSLVTLTCKQRQKEIAIRKINGATVRDILTIFAREHLVLLSLSALVSFPVGYALMKHWLQTYIEQTEISAWIFIGIYAAVGAVIALTIGWRVWRTANENPAEVIKRE